MNITKASILTTALFSFLQLPAQQFYFPKTILKDSAKLAEWMPELADKVIQDYKEDNSENYLNNLFRLQILAGKFQSAVESINSLRNIDIITNGPNAKLFYRQQELYAKAKLLQNVSHYSFQNAFRQEFKTYYSHLSDKDADFLYSSFFSRHGIGDLKNQFERTLHTFESKDSLTIDEAVQLCRNYQLFHSFKNIEPIAKVLLKEDDFTRYIVEDSTLINASDGAVLSAIVVRSRNVTALQPAALVFTIYTDFERNLSEAKQSATHGYVGVVADTRGKRLSVDSIVPYEHEAKDVNAVIDWVIKQPWSNGKVGMYGGSYLGFTQWAATNIFSAFCSLFSFSFGRRIRPSNRINNELLYL